MSKVAEQLTRARQTLLDHNWYPEYLSTCDNHAYCLLTALVNTVNLADRVLPMNALIDELPEPYVDKRSYFDSLMSFNDAPGRTKADAIAVYDRAIGRAMWIRE